MLFAKGKGMALLLQEEARSGDQVLMRKDERGRESEV